MAHSKEAHAQMPGAMKKFNEGHWEKSKGDVSLGGSRYSSGEMNQEEEYKSDVNALSTYVKKHKAKH
jgi:hypothetical protein